MNDTLTLYISVLRRPRKEKRSSNKLIGNTFVCQIDSRRQLVGKYVYDARSSSFIITVKSGSSWLQSKRTRFLFRLDRVLVSLLVSKNWHNHASHDRLFLFEKQHTNSSCLMIQFLLLFFIQEEPVWAEVRQLFILSVTNMLVLSRGVLLLRCFYATLIFHWNVPHHHHHHPRPVLFNIINWALSQADL